MDRRAFLHTLAAATLLAVPLAAEAQPAGNVYRIGHLTISSAREELMLQPLLKALHDLGYVEGRHLVIEHPDMPMGRRIGSRPSLPSWSNGSWT